MISVKLTYTYEYKTALELPDDATPEQIREEIKTLWIDDFRQVDGYLEIEVFRDDGTDISHEVQAIAPNLTPLDTQPPVV